MTITFRHVLSTCLFVILVMASTVSKAELSEQFLPFAPEPISIAELADAKKRGATIPFDVSPGSIYTSSSSLSATFPADKDTYLMTVLEQTTISITVNDCCVTGDTICFGTSVQQRKCGVSPSFPTHTVTLSPGTYTFYVAYQNVSTGFPAGYTIEVTGAGGGSCTEPWWNPSKWNDDFSVRYNNNCYNYANDEITMTFAQPGRACGDMYSQLNCSEVWDAAICDGLIPLTGPDDSCPDGWHKVYLVNWPGRDYHWYRIDTGGLWSHKPGSTAATQFDSSGQYITDPVEADTGAYTARCGYMCACGDDANIQ